MTDVIVYSALPENGMAGLTVLPIPTKRRAQNSPIAGPETQGDFPWRLPLRW